MMKKIPLIMLLQAYLWCISLLKILSGVIRILSFEKEIITTQKQSVEMQVKLRHELAVTLEILSKSYGLK